MSQAFHNFKWLPLLLIGLSMTTLIGFMGYWLHQSFAQQKKWLSKEVHYQFHEGLRSYQDSIVKELIRDRLPEHDSLGRPLAEDFKGIVRVFLQDSSELQKGKLPSEQLEPKGIQESPLYSHYYVSRFPRMQKDTTLKSARIAYNREFRKKQNEMRFISLQDTLIIDTNYLKKTFVNNLRQSGIYLPAKLNVWSLQDSIADDEGNIASMIMPGGVPTMNLYQGEVTDATFYLLGKIFPEILFSLLLLGLIGLAFTVIWKNLAKQQRLNAMKNDFISNITHELKTPISTVSVAVEAMQHFNVLADPDKTSEYLSMARSELHRLSLLVDKVLKTSLFEQDKVSLEKERLDLRDIIETVKEAMKLPMDQKNATLDLRFQGNNFEITGDKTHLTNVLINLLDNALKYHRGDPHIEILLSETEEDILLTVGDDGPGIPAEYRERIFDRFFRIPSGNCHNVKGHGLGLSYVSDVIKRHEGEISLVDSQKGASFVIKLPKFHEAA